MGNRRRKSSEGTFVLDTDEAIRYLRLDRTGIKHPRMSIHRYRRLGKIRGIQIGRQFLWDRDSLDSFIAGRAS